MGDISNETSMEDILSSIKRIIAEEAEPVAAIQRPRKVARPVDPIAAPSDERVQDDHPDDVLELDAYATAASSPRRETADAIRPAAPGKAEPAERPARPAASAQPAGEGILSAGTADATSRSLEALSRMIVRPEVQGSDTLEGLVKEMLRPMLRDWLDAHLPAMVEQLVAKEIARITGRQG
ncbi:DUF2497 domain-containing protein [Sphingomonas sp. FW199]|uniref:DUF2497 domain-containing protein n=1 Tax=Sphingomonas sp. FW199 TaxID=3400217 RepID=UPI003CFA27AE